MSGLGAHARGEGRCRDRVHRVVPGYPLEDLPRVGGKNASLGELYGELTTAGVRVPNGFAVTARGVRRAARRAGLRARMAALLAGHRRPRRRRRWPAPRRARPSAHPGGALAGGPRARRSARPTTPSRGKPGRIRASPCARARPPRTCPRRASPGSRRPSSACGAPTRSSPRAGAASRRSSPTGPSPIGSSTASTTSRSASPSASSAWSAPIWARPGVMFTLDPESGFPGRRADQRRVRPGRGRRPGTARSRRVLGLQADAPRGPAGDPQAQPLAGRTGSSDSAPTARRRASRSRPRRRPRLSLADAEVLELSRLGLAIETHYSAKAGGRRRWTSSGRSDGADGRLYILQARPETVHRAERRPSIAGVHARSDRGVRAARDRQGVGQRIGVGRARRLRASPGISPGFGPGEVLVAPMTDPDWEPVMKRAAAIVTDRGGRTCHAAIVSRELGVPCVVGTERGHRAHPGGRDRHRVAAPRARSRPSTAGRVPFERRTVDLTQPAAPGPRRSC